MFKIVDAAQIAANAGWPNAPNREGTGLANIAEESASVLKSISEGSRAPNPPFRNRKALLAVQVVCASGLTALPAYSRGEEKIVRMSFRLADA
jgi:hypothetical protein